MEMREALIIVIDSAEVRYEAWIKRGKGQAFGELEDDAIYLTEPDEAQHVAANLGTALRTIARRMDFVWPREEAK